ncbi:MAG: hypothetical protein KGJ90_06820 [Patescibacteria group bacterium]|nr:hypothetical protein [Patescibacteria group bacterium]
MSFAQCNCTCCQQWGGLFNAQINTRAKTAPMPEEVTAEQLMDRIKYSHYNYLCMVEEIKRMFPNGVKIVNPTPTKEK